MNEIINEEHAESTTINENGEDNIESLPKRKNENKSKSGTYTHKFKVPFEYEGKKYETIVFSFGKLSGRDMIDCENEMQNNNEFAIDPLLSRNFLSKIASKACGVGSDVIEAMPLRDFTQITNAARNFLADSGY